MKKFLSLVLCAMFINMMLPAFAIDESTTEHLKQPRKIAKKAQTDIVRISDTNVNVISYNVIPLVFTEKFTSQTARVGDEIVFMVKKDIVTKEGTVILPAGVRVISEITEVKKPKAFNRSGKVYITFKEIALEDGTRQPIEAKLFAKKDFLSRGKLNALGKGVGSVFSTTAVGTGAGCGIGVAAGAVVVGGLAIGLPIGVGVGVLSGVLTPGLYYKAKPGDKINILLVNDLILEK